MEITNRNNYPIAFVNAAKTRIYRPEKNRIGVTQLIGSPLARTLLIEKWDEIVLDVDDFIDTIYGTAVDVYLRQYESDKILSQCKLEHIIQGITLVGVPDRICLDYAFIGDYKFWKVASLRFEQTDAIAQLNLYRWLAKKRFDWTLDTLYLHPMLKDWRILPDYLKKNERDYPECRIPTFELPVWNYDTAEAYINSRLSDHLNNPNRPCNAEEKWESETTYALKKKDKKTAIIASFAGSGGEKKFHNEQDCINEAIRTKKIKTWPQTNYFVEKRSGECRKCKNYCTVRSVCDFAKGLK